jgi:hypothetical protein
MKLKKRSLAVQKNNTDTFNLSKVKEELTELLLILSQDETREIDPQKIIDEIGDVKRVLWWLEDKYGADKVTARIKNKLNKLEKKYKVC